MSDAVAIVAAALQQGTITFPPYEQPKSVDDAAQINKDKALIIASFYRDVKAALAN